MNRRAKQEIVACLGSSSTAGKGQAFDWIGELARRPGNAGFEFRNFGMGGDLAIDALHRVESVLAARPDRVIVWIGANDALAIVSPKARRLFCIMRLASRQPSLEAFQESLATIVERTKRAGARVALCSLAPIGEELPSEQPFQSALNATIGDLNAWIERTARGHGVAYVPIFEAFQAAIAGDPGRPLTAFRLLPMYRDAFRTLVLRLSPDEVGQRNGWKFHSDGIHLNRRGGTIAADLVQAYLDDRQGSETCGISRIRMECRRARMSDADDEKVIRDLIEAWADAVRREDIEAILKHHAADFVMFDVPPPFEIHGLDDYRKSWDLFFSWSKNPVPYEIHTLNITAGADVAFAVATMGCAEPDQKGDAKPLNFRLTMGLRKIDGAWMIVHEHHSIPAID